MIDLVKNIGRVDRELSKKLDLIELWQKDEDDYDNILLINVKENKTIEKKTIAFYQGVFKDSLFYQKGRGHVGAAIKIDSFKNTKNSIKKISNKVTSCFDFMELDKDLMETVINIIIEELENTNQSYIISFQKEGNMALDLDLYKEKFNEIIETTYLNRAGEGICHLCGEKGQIFNTVLYDCYTNDKQIYSNTEGLTFSVCRECLQYLLQGKKYVEKYLTTYWAGSEVMFLPHDFNSELKDIYQETEIGKESSTSLLKNIRENEPYVLNIVGKSQSLTDIVFFHDTPGRSEWKIEYHIRDVMPSRFSKIASLLVKYNYNDPFKHITIKTLQNILAEKTGNSRKRLLDIILHEKKFERRLFFIKLMQNYRTAFYEGKRSMLTFHMVYNFMCEAGCLNKPWQLMQKKERGGWEIMHYKNIEEFFDKNQKFFDQPEKKAWFIMGHVFDKTIYYSKWADARSRGLSKEEFKNKINEFSSHLEKGFYFGRKFDYRTFVYFANLCADKLIKYDSYYKYIKELINEAKELMGTGLMQISNDEAKYIFFWGKDMWFSDKED